MSAADRGMMRAKLYKAICEKPLTMAELTRHPANVKNHTYSTSCREWAEYGLIAKDSKGRWHSLLAECASYQCVVADGTVQPAWHIGGKQVHSGGGNKSSKTSQSRYEAFPAKRTVSKLIKKKDSPEAQIKADTAKNKELSADQSIESDISQILSDKEIQNTERESYVLSRIGQGKFRLKLIEYWKKCAVTGCAEIGILRASHIKPWAKCNNQERMDHFNGLLLIPNLDSLFDQGLLSFADDGKIIVSEILSDSDRKLLGVNESMKINISEMHKGYLKYHRENILKSM